MYVLCYTNQLLTAKVGVVFVVLGERDTGSSVGKGGTIQLPV